MNRIGAAVLALACALGTVRAGASEQSEAFSSRGLIELDAGRTAQALQLFDQAVAADPDDPVARYNRGTSRAKLKDFPGAIEDLQWALARRPDFPAAALELGIALDEIGQYEQAIPWLTQAQADPGLAAQASFFLGIAQLRLDRLDAARENFQRARALDASLDTQARYYEGVVAYRARDMAGAEEQFAAVERASPESAMGRESRGFRELIRRAERSAYQVFGAVALEYDSNVTLAPNEVVPGSISGQGDGRAVLNAGGAWAPWQTRRVRLALSYEFFQSLQFQLTEYNLQDNRPGVQVSFDFDPVEFGVLGRYDYYLLSTDSFLQEVTAFPWVALREENIGRTELYWRMQHRDFKKLDYAVLNGFYNSGGVRQVFELGSPDKRLWIGYEMEFTDPEGGGSELYQFGSYQLEGVLRWPLPFLLTGEVGYRYERQNYAGASSAFTPTGPPRRDNDHRVLVALERPITDHLLLSAAYFGTFNQSNKIDFEYDRQIGSIGLEARY